MTGNVALLLVYEPIGSCPLTVARVDDRRVLRAAAESIILDAEARAEELASVDVVLGEIERAEASRLRRVLATMIPELRSERSGLDAAVM